MLQEVHPAEVVQAGATVVLAGIDLRVYLEADDTERELIEQVAERVLEQRELLDQNLAVRIATEVGRLFRG